MPPSISPPRSTTSGSDQPSTISAARAERQQQRVADRETDGHAHRARPPQRRRLPGRAHRQRGDRHEVIGAETVEETEGQCGREQEHNAVYCRFRTHRTSTFRGT